MASKRLTFEEAVEELRRADRAVSNFQKPDGMVWAYNYDSNGIDGEWDAMTGFVGPDDLIPDYGPFVVTDTENEVLDQSVLTRAEHLQALQDQMENAEELGLDRAKVEDAYNAFLIGVIDEDEEFIETCPADDEQYDRRTDLNHELHDSEHPNHSKFCHLSADHWHVAPHNDPNRGWMDDETGKLPLETIRFTPRGALDRISSFLSLFENDGITDMVTLDQAVKTLFRLINEREADLAEMEAANEESKAWLERFGLPLP